MIYQNHSIDPTYFWDAIEEFSFDYKIYVVGDMDLDDYGNRKINYKETTIRGSLQSNSKKLIQSKSGNTNNLEYDFYCKSLYRIDIGDIIEYNHNYLRVTSVHDYDEYGVREAHLIMISLSAYRDFADYLDYINGKKLV